jgi:LSD1 subclass zinc finger protein
MLQVRCPSCRRLLDVPDGSERSSATCPRCRATFVPAGGVHETAVTAVPGAGTRLETGIQTAPAQLLRSPARKARFTTESLSIELSAGLGYADYRVAALTFFVTSMIGMAIAAGFGGVWHLPTALPFAAVAAAHSILYCRVMRGFRSDGHETRWWFYVVGSALYVGALGAALLFDPADRLDDVLMGFLVTPLLGALIGVAIWGTVVVAGMVLLHGRLRTLMFEVLLPDAIEPAAGRRNAVPDEALGRPKAPKAGDVANADPHAIELP